MNPSFPIAHPNTDDLGELHVAEAVNQSRDPSLYCAGGCGAYRGTSYGNIWRDGKWYCNKCLAEMPSTFEPSQNTSSPDIEREAEREWRECHSPITEIRKFIPKTSWKLPCPKCGKTWNSNPGDCPNPTHHEHYQKHLKTNRENRHVRD